ncbi:MAG: hypothetical protein ACRD4B_03425, partial [Acidobacteriota bacterium]
LEVLDEVLCIYKTIEDDGPMRAARFHGEGFWTFRDFPFKIYAAGLTAGSSGSMTWDDLEGTWEAQDYAWNSAVVEAEQEILALGGDNGGLSQTFTYNFTSNDDAGVALPVTIETKDFSFPNFKIRVDYMTLLLSGGTITVSYSTDKGASWQTYGTIVADATVRKYRLYKQVTEDRIRFRFETEDSFVLELYSIQAQPETEW